MKREITILRTDFDGPEYHTMSCPGSNAIRRICKKGTVVQVCEGGVVYVGHDIQSMKLHRSEELEDWTYRFDKLVASKKDRTKEIADMFPMTFSLVIPDEFLA